MSDTELNALITVEVDHMLEDNDPPSPGGVEDELARKMNSLGRAPEGVENPVEVGGDCSGDLVVLESVSGQQRVVKQKR